MYALLMFVGELVGFVMEQMRI